jgi:hypothetical protein
MNADRMVESPAKRKVKKNKGLGAVIINLQRTRLDDICSLRIWADADTVFALLAKQLQISSALIVRSAPIVRALVPYDGDGLPRSDPLMLVDVSEGQEVVVGQPSDNEFRHRKGQIDDIDEFGNPLMTLQGKRGEGGKPGKLARRACLGHWWLSEAARGDVRVKKKKKSIF